MMRLLSLAVAALLSSPSVFAAPPRMVGLETHQSPTGLERGCTPDQLCVEIIPRCDGPACSANTKGSTDLGLRLFAGQGEPADTVYPLTDFLSEGEATSPQLWPMLIRFQDGLLAGVQTQVQATYSGGSASSTSLHLIAFLPGQAPFEVLSVPQHAYAMIRACFSEQDMGRRAGACHDEYSFEADLTLAGASPMGMPVLHYRSKATAFPGPVSRSKDSLARRPLRKRDLVTFTDPQCSYQRWYRFDPQARSYLPDRPEPDCTNYIEP